MAAEWVRVHVRTTADVVELAADLLWSAGCAGLEEQVGPGEMVLLAGFDDRERAAEALQAIEGAGFGVGEVRAVLDDGLDAWREWASVERAEPFVLCPTWLDPPPLAVGEHLLALDPGRTFGSGSHPTTRLVLSLAAAHVAAGRPVRTVLDVGCGSGVLAIGAALLGADEVVGIDVDPAAPAVVRANAERNGVADRVRATTTALAELPMPSEGFDLVLANLLAPIVVDLAPHLARATAEHGRLVVSGLLADRWERAVGALESMAVDAVVELDGWAAVVLRHDR